MVQQIKTIITNNVLATLVVLTVLRTIVAESAYPAAVVSLGLLTAMYFDKRFQRSEDSMKAKEDLLSEKIQAIEKSQKAAVDLLNKVSLKNGFGEYNG